MTTSNNNDHNDTKVSYQKLEWVMLMLIPIGIFPMTQKTMSLARMSDVDSEYENNGDLCVNQFHLDPINQVWQIKGWGEGGYLQKCGLAWPMTGRLVFEAGNLHHLLAPANLPSFCTEILPGWQQKSPICTNLLHTKQALCVHWDTHRQSDRRRMQKVRREKLHIYFN